MTTNAVATQGAIRNYWWLLLLEGIAALVLGVILFMQPAATLVILTTFLGAYWLVEGVFKVIAAFTGQRGDTSWWLLLLSGLLGIVAGIVVFSAPLMSALITQLFLVYMLAFQALIGGILSIIWAIRVRKEIQGEGWVILGGILAIVLGVLLISSPLISILLLAKIAGVSAVIGGIGLIIAAFRWRK